MKWLRVMIQLDFLDPSTQLWLFFSVYKPVKFCFIILKWKAELSDSAFGAVSMDRKWIWNGPEVILEGFWFQNSVAWSFIAGCLCGFQQFDGPIPISKRLWTFSFAALLSGWGFLVLAGLYLLLDHFKVWSGAPFNFVGMNSILIYILHENLSGQVPFCGVECTSTTTNHMIQMWTQTGAVAVWILYAYYCHLRKFYLVIWNVFNKVKRKHCHYCSYIM